MCLMLPFHYYAPTEVVFGPDAEEHTGELLHKYGAKRVLIHYGSPRVVKTGLVPGIEKSLEALGISYCELGGVVPNPHLSKVREGIALGRKEKIDFILAVGGGSVIDSAKAIGYGLADAEQGDVWDFYDYKRAPKACLPVGVVLTIAATGSEMSNSSVITNEEGGIKRGCNTDYSRPKFAVMNPKLTMTLPEYQTMSGATDICMHTMERYLNRGGHMELTNGIAEALLRTVIASAKTLLKEPQNYEARAEIMWASSLSHNGLTGCGTDGGDWACHKLEHELGGMFDCAHGAGLAAIWGTWARYVYREAPDRFANLGRGVFGIDEKDDLRAAEKCIEAFEAFFKDIHMPVCLDELGVHPADAQYRELADKCYAATRGDFGSMKKLTRDDMEKIYRGAQKRQAEE